MTSWFLMSASEEQTAEIGFLLGRCLDTPTLILLEGNLGAGKTVVARGIARGMGVAAEVPITSPTFTLMNHYPARLDLYHFDLYRLSGPEDLIDIGFDDYAFGAGVALVEWPEKLENSDIGGVWITIAAGAAGSRRLTFRGKDPQALKLLDSFASELQSAGFVINPPD